MDMSKTNTILEYIGDVQKLFPEWSMTEVLSKVLDIEIPFVEDEDMVALLRDFYFQNMR